MQEEITLDLQEQKQVIISMYGTVRTSRNGKNNSEQFTNNVRDDTVT
jgi:hypothetical protein